MAKAYLKDYVKKIESKYLLARSKYIACVEKLKAENDKYNHVDKSQYTYKGLQILNAKHNDIIAKCREDMDAIRMQFVADASEIVKASDKVFNRMYCYTPSDIDSNGVTILEKGSLDNAEIMRLGLEYLQTGNSTMYFMCADKLKGAEDAESRKYYLDAINMRRDREDHKIFDYVINMCSAGLRTGTIYDSNDIDGAISSCEMIENNMDDYLSRALEDAENIAIPVANPWE